MRLAENQDLEMKRPREESASAHEPVQSKDDLQPGSERAFGLVFATVFVIVTFYPLFVGGVLHRWALVVSLLFLAAALIRPGLLRPANLLWFRFGLLLHVITNPLILGAIFFLVITPIALVMRWSGRDLLLLKPDAGAASYWISRVPPGPEPETMKRQF
jgi:hypothetical protein